MGKERKPPSDKTNHLTELALKYQSGDHSAFDDLFNIAQKMFISYFRPRISLPYYLDVQDLFQVTMLKVYGEFDKFVPHRGRFIRWFFTIARNEVISMIRKKRPQTLSLEFGWDSDEKLSEIEPAINWKPIELALAREVLNKILEGIQNLKSDEQCSVLVSRIVLGKNEKEISRTLERPLNTVKSDYRRGLNGVLEYLRQNGYPEAKQLKGVELFLFEQISFNENDLSVIQNEMNRSVMQMLYFEKKSIETCANKLGLTTEDVMQYFRNAILEVGRARIRRIKYPVERMSDEKMDEWLWDYSDKLLQSTLIEKKRAKIRVRGISHTESTPTASLEKLRILTRLAVLLIRGTESAQREATLGETLAKHLFTPLCAVPFSLQRRRCG